MLMLIEPERRLAFLTKVMSDQPKAYKQTQPGHPGCQRLLRQFQPGVYAAHLIHDREQIHGTYHPIALK